MMDMERRNSKSPRRTNKEIISRFYPTRLGPDARAAHPQLPGTRRRDRSKVEDMTTKRRGVAVSLLARVATDSSQMVVKQTI
jgi:hypothetical protein